MEDSKDTIFVSHDQSDQFLHIAYHGQSLRCIYDICDLNGRILRSGQFENGQARVQIDDLRSDCYILLVLDGDKVSSRKITLQQRA